MNIEAAQTAKEAGADYLGFVFAPSRRQVDPKISREIINAVPGIGKVGVFVNEDIKIVQQIADRCGLDYVQLCGDESPAYCQAVGYPVIKVAKVPPHGIVPDMKEYRVAWLLLDTYQPGSHGGTGKTFDWHTAGQCIASGMPAPVIVAGGLQADNVGEAIRQARPQGVDVSGGVETDGKKDIAKIAAFIKAARAAERSYLKC